MNSSKPFVTVLMPVYNAERYVGEAIDSILNQSYLFFELVIINDGSTDSSEKVIRSYSDNRIVIVNNEENKGLIETLNKGLSLAKGTYIARMDADDISTPDRLEKQVSFLETNPAIGLVGSSYTLFDESHEVIAYPEQQEDIRLACVFHNPFCHPAVLFRKEIVDTHKLVFKKEYLHAEDYKFWTEFVLLTECHNLKESLLFYRSHSDQISQMHNEEQLINSRKIQKEYLEGAGFSLTEKEVWHIVGKGKGTSQDTVLDTLKSIEKLIYQNETIQFFNQQLLERYFSSIIRNTILEAKSIDSEAYGFITKNPLTQKIKWTNRQKISLYFKYLQHKFK